MEKETDQQISRLVQAELKKIADQITTTSKVTEKKLVLLEKTINIENLNKMIDLKLGKADAKKILDNQEARMKEVEKKQKNVITNMERIDVIFLSK